MFYAYWRAVCRPTQLRQAWVAIAKYPHLLNSFCSVFSHVDFNGIAEYMKQTNWKYHNQVRFNTKEDLMATVLSLTQHCVESDYSEDPNQRDCWETGGFKVETSNITNENCEVKITFNKSLSWM